MQLKELRFSVGLWTEVAFELLLLIVDGHVSLETTHCGERLTAHLASVGALTTMRRHVCLQMLSDTERLSTKDA